MEKDFGSWFLYQQSGRVSPNLDTSTAPFNLGPQNSIPAYMSHCANVGSTNGVFPWSPFSGFSHSKATQPIEPHAWFNFPPRFQQAFTPPRDTTFIEMIPSGPRENRVEVIQPDDKASGRDQKRFLVFDQSGDQTTLMFSSGIGTPAQCLTSLGPTLNNAYVSNLSERGTGKDAIHCAAHILTDECNENQRDTSESDMHEDTEEINALLYSDDDDYYNEDDEEASTGHSPSTMTAYDKQDLPEESEEVASCDGPTKRMKLSNGGYDVLDTASSFKSKRCFDCEDGAESSCAGGKNLGLGEKFVSVIGNKRSREDKIRETVRIMQNIVPGRKGKDVIAILDEAIGYLTSLKHKAMALGLDETL